MLRKLLSSSSSPSSLCGKCYLSRYQSNWFMERVTLNTNSMLKCTYRPSFRQCATHGKEKVASAASSSESSSAAHAASSKVNAKMAEKDATAVRTGPQRKDWRSKSEVVYVKGIPVKGSLFKLPWSEQLLNCLIFSVAGMGAVYIVKPQIRYLCENGFFGLTPEAGWIDGPWLYRVMYLLIMFPSYSALLWCTASCFSRRMWFSFMILKMWSRFLTKKGSQRLARILDIAHI